MMTTAKMVIMIGRLHVQKGQIQSHSTATRSRITSEESTSVCPKNPAKKNSDGFGQ
jgi:hypothetical protein